MSSFFLGSSEGEVPWVWVASMFAEVVWSRS
jgi:hypothetical protein